MATKLNKDVTRETEVLIDGKPLWITLTEDQKLVLKIKGTKKTKTLEITELWENKEKLFVKPEEEKQKVNKIIKEDSKEPLVNLNWLRAQSAITNLDLKDTVKFDMILKSLIDIHYENLKKN
jgi:hypothetical protein